MDGRDLAQSVISQFGGTIGMPSLRLDEQGFCSLRFDDRIAVSLQYDGHREQLLVYSNLGPAEPDERGYIYETLLKANLFWRSSCDATFSLTDDTPPLVVLALACPLATLSPQGFGAIVERFVNSAEDWLDALRAPDAPEQPSSFPMTDFMIRV